jgi:Protein kinase domain
LASGRGTRRHAASELPKMASILPWGPDRARETAALAEVQRLERLIVRLWQLTSVFGVVTGAVYALAVSRALGLGCALASALFLTWFALVGYLLDRNRGSRALTTINTLVEAMVPWAFTVVIVLTRGAPYALASWVPPFLFSACIVAYVVRLRPWLPLVFGFVGAVFYPVVYFALMRDRIPEDARQLLINQPATQFTRSFALMGAGMIATLLAVGLRHVVRTAEGSSNVLGRYRIGRELGSSPTGVVYSARYRPEGGFDRRVMLRRLPPGTSEHAELVLAFRQQAELATHLVHPNIVQVLDFGTADTTHVVITEFADGVTLDPLKQRVLATGTPLDPALVRYIGVSILSALEFAHGGVRDNDGNVTSHFLRDLCPARVFLFRNGLVKIGGFSVPPSIRDLGRARSGHEEYMAPEQRHGICDARSDLYSTAAILWELLVAKPFRADAALAVEFDANSGWDVFFASALAAEPDQRAASARELSKILEPFAAPMHDKAARAMSSLVNALSPRARDGVSETSLHHDAR